MFNSKHGVFVSLGMRDYRAQNNTSHMRSGTFPDQYIRVIPHIKKVTGVTQGSPLTFDVVKEIC